MHRDSEQSDDHANTRAAVLSAEVCPSEDETARGKWPCTPSSPHHNLSRRPSWLIHSNDACCLTQGYTPGSVCVCHCACMGALVLLHTTLFHRYVLSVMCYEVAQTLSMFLPGFVSRQSHSKSRFLWTSIQITQSTSSTQWTCCH